ncbi:MAG: geranylgeranylglyceryl/heptaprenylglyceryl phosphate synthase [Ignavibacteria bacterium]
MKVYNYLDARIKTNGAACLILIDPDKISGQKLVDFVRECEVSGVDGLLVGGSLIINGNLARTIDTIKKSSALPAIIFPGSVSQVTPEADAMLFISLISGRNAEHLIGEHVMVSPLIKNYNIETISTGYMLIESGQVTTAEYISGSKPIPRNKPEIAMATALAAQYLGMKMVYLEAGSGAQLPVPDEMVKIVSSALDIPVIVGGGIRDASTARQKVEAGAKIVVTGNYFEDDSKWELLKEFSEAVHTRKNF